MKPMLFFLVFIGVMALLNLYIYRRLFKQLHFNLDRFGATLCFSLFFLQVLFVLELGTGQLAIPSLMFKSVSASVGVTFLLFVVTLVYDLLHTPAKRIPFDAKRRRFIKIVLDSTMLVMAATYLFKGIAGGLRRPFINRVEVPVKSAALNGLRIAQLSDMHIGRTIGKTFVQECVERVNALKPDLVAITGDLVDLDAEQAADALAPLRELKSRYGTYFILGNHEYFRGPEAIAQLVESLGITVLLNRSVIVGEGGARFNLVGINDLVSKRMGVLPYDIERAFGACDPDLPSIVLAHQPKTVKITTHKDYDLMLSGHTHGGQIFPFGLLVMIDQPYIAGLYAIDGQKQIFVSRGTGYWGPPLRVLAPSEISLLTLRSV